MWRGRSDFIIAADISAYSAKADFEQLWARQLDDDLFELCCIPFFLYDLALGDVVRTSSAPGREYLVSEVVRRSGRYVFRVWFGDTFHPRDRVEDDLAAMGCLLEWSSTNLLAVDASDGRLAQKVADHLAEAERADELTYETGWS